MAQEIRQLIGPFPSKMQNTCTFCSFKVHRFSPIFFYKQRRTKEEIASGVPAKGAIVLHASECATKWMAQQNATSGDLWEAKQPIAGAPVEDTEENEPTPIQSEIKPIAQPVAPANGDLLSIIAQSVLPLVQSQFQAKLDESQVRAIAKSIIEDAIAKIKYPITRVEVQDVATGNVQDLGLQHKQFPALLKASQARLSDGHRLNIWIGGPAGSGKSKAGEFVAKALSLEFAYTGSFNESHKIFGYVSPVDGKYHSTPFRDAYENGKVFMFDDFDGSDPVCAIELLGMLANGHAAFPDGMVSRHKDFLCMISANTFGHGATSDYVGRLKQDKALLNRFITFDWQYDEVLETATSGNEAWSKRVQMVRRNVQSKGLKVLVTPRATYLGAALLAVGFEQSEVEAMVFANAMSSEQWEMVK